MSDRRSKSRAPMTAATTCHFFQGVTWLLTVPGASRTVLEARVPYAQSALQDALKFPTASYATAGTAVDMAKAAYKQAAQLSEIGTSIIGIGCTCALMTDRVKKGDHKVHFVHLTDMHVASMRIFPAAVLSVHTTPSEQSHTCISFTVRIRCLYHAQLALILLYEHLPCRPDWCISSKCFRTAATPQPLCLKRSWLSQSSSVNLSAASVHPKSEAPETAETHSPAAPACAACVLLHFRPTLLFP